MQYRKLNIARIREKVSDIREALTMLRQYANLSDETFLSNKEAVLAARYSFIVMVEAAMNIANHFCARLLDKAPSTYAEAFLLLGQEGVMDSQLSRKLADMARFRNLLVHGYGKVDDRKMLGSMRQELSDVDAFLREVARIVSAQEDESGD